MKELGNKRFLPGARDNFLSFRLNDDLDITQEMISSFYSRLKDRFDGELNLLSLHLRLKYTAELDGAANTTWASAKRFVVSPKLIEEKQIEAKIHEALDKLCNGLSGSGWSVIAYHSLDVAYYANIEAFLADDWSGKYFWVVKSRDNHLSYAVASGSAVLDNPKLKHRERDMQYSDKVLAKTRSLSYQAEHFNMNIDLYKIQDGLLRLYQECVVPNSKGRIIIVEKDGVYHVTTKALGINQTKCDECKQHVQSGKMLEHCEKHQKKNEVGLMKDNDMIFFRKYKSSLQKKVVVFADFEALNIPIAEANHEIFKNAHLPKNMDTIHYGITCCAALIYDGELKDTFTYSGFDMIDRFIDKMYEWNAKWNVSSFTSVKNIVYDERYVGSRCFGCGRDVYVDEEKSLVRHHDHFTGKFICVAHRSCNSGMKVDKTLSIFFHNFKGYDSKLIIKQLQQTMGIRFHKVIAKGREKFLTFTIESSRHGTDKLSLRIMDSYAFLSKGLNDLLKEDPINALRFVKERYPDAAPGKAEIDFQDYVSFDVLEDKPKMDKLERYCMIDTLGLAGIFTTFCEMVYKTHAVDPVSCLGAPGLAWQAALKTSQICLHPYRKLEYYHLFKDNIRGGYTNVIKRYSASGPDNKIQYYDINALYSWAMTQPLPHGDFRELPIDNEEWRAPFSEEDRTCYFILADWSVPVELADKLSDLPPFAERVDSKLISDLRPKLEYLTHYRIAQQALGLGLHIDKIHRVIACSQSPFFKSYIYDNIRLRAQHEHIATLKETFKLLNNALYGKTIENIENYCNLIIEDRWSGVHRAFLSVEPPVEVGNWVVTSTDVTPVATKPTYVGFSILEMSKWKMIDEWYNVYQPAGCHLLYMDTDSFIFESKTGVDFSSSELGHFKDELNGGLIWEYAGIRPKTYAYTGFKRKRDKDTGLEECEEVACKKAKGVKTFKREAGKKIDLLSFEDYRDRIPKMIPQEEIRSFEQQLGSLSYNKYCWLNDIDSKRFLCEDKINTLPWGHPNAK